jgi:hypothetical protein
MADEPAAASAHDVAVIAHGAIADAGWALARLNDGDALDNQSFAYPETTQPVRLYLIDSPVAHLGTWFARNPKLTLEATFGIGGNVGPSSYEHGTKMLSLIAGPSTGAAAGTPIRLVTYNDYPLSESGASVARMTEAVYQAVDYQQAHPGLPGVICLASGSQNPASSASLRSAVEDALAAGITVVVSAGNAGQDAALFIPSAYGSLDGVICVGASDANNVHLPTSNKGPAVDLYAPGYQVRSINHISPFSGTFGSMTGTSPATALTAAAAIIELSKNPALTPAQVEAVLEGEAVATVTPPAPLMAPASLVQVQPDPEGDSDGDGMANILERFFGSNAADSTVLPSPATVTPVQGGVQLSFLVAADLYNNGSATLSDGSTWRIRCSENLTHWTDAAGTLSPGTVVDGKIPVTFSMPTTARSCFLKIEVVPAP